MKRPGFNPAQLVKRGVFGSLEEARSRATITPESWRRVLRCDVPIFLQGGRGLGESHNLAGAGATPAPAPIFSTGAGLFLQRASPSPTSLAAGPVDSLSRRRMAAGSAAGHPHPLQDAWPAAECSPAQRPEITGPVNAICPWCAIERAMNGQGAAPRTGFVSVARCERHCAESTAGSLNPNPNAGVVQAFPKGRWS